MDTLKISNLSVSFGKNTVLNNIDLQCNTGDILGVFGRNGSGKSTLLKAVFGILKARSIDVQINTTSITQKDSIASKRIGYLPQHPFLPKEMKVRDIISLFYSDAENQDKIFYAPKIGDFQSKKVGMLSLGELRYLELLLISNLNHSFLLLDEPFSMIEPLYKTVIKSFLIQLKESKGIIITDHYYEDVLAISTKNILLKNGQKFEINSKQDLVKHGYLNRIS